MKFEDLKFVRLNHPDQFKLIPKKLFEQVKGSGFNIDKVYEFGPLLLMSPLTYFYVLMGDKPAVEGILWAEVNPFSDSLHVHVFSIKKEYQGNSALDVTLDFLEVIQKDNNLNKIQMTTTRPKAYMKKQSWKRSKQIILEI